MRLNADLWDPGGSIEGSEKDPKNATVGSFPES